MKLKIYILVLSILLSANISTYAQNSMKILKYYTKADSLTIDPNSFFPMQVGNFWQYAFQNEIVREERVIKDSSLNENLKLIWLSLDGHDSSSPRFALDTNYNVYYWQPALELENMEHHFKLNADLGEEWIYAGFDSTHYFFRKIESIFEAEYLGVKTIFKEIVEYARDEEQDYLRHKYILGAGLGIVNKRNDSDVEPPEYLIAAIINGDTLGTIVGVKDDYSNLIPSDIELFQNYPNPFNPTTTISYKLKQAGYTRLKIFSLLGEEIKTIVNQYQHIGNYNYSVDMSGLPSGMYTYCLFTNKTFSAKKMIYLK